jgi:predicted TIM-barrel fold metal-dependent hydrolase
MIIDIHTHIGDLSKTGERTPVTLENLLARLDDEGIDKAVVLPIISAETIGGPNLLGGQLDVASLLKRAAQHSDRLILFGNVDPRMNGNRRDADFSWVLERFVAMGCVGLGEVTANLYADDPRVINLFQQCGRLHLPVLIHGTGPGEGLYGLIDGVGSPRLERLLQEAAETVVIGHGPGFWAEIGTGISLQDKSGYPAGPIAAEGSLARLLRTYTTLYADISAGSGHNALTRDPEYGVRFIAEFQDRLLFGTDVCFGDPQGRMPHLGFLRRLLAEGQITQQILDKITAGNALRILPRLASAH